MDLIYLIFKLIFIAFAIIFIPLLFNFLVYYLYFRIKLHYKMPKRLSKFKQRGLFTRIYKDFPKQFWLDSFNSVPGEFKEYGLHLVCGEQGSGKTTAVVQLLLDNWSKKYPFLKIYTNMFYKYQDGEIMHWKDLLREDRNNGTFRRR